MRLSCVAAGVAVALAACGYSSSAGQSSSTTSTASPSASCGPRSAQTLIADQKARVYARSGRAYGCAGQAERSYELGSLGNCIRTSRAGPIALAGEIAAYGLQTCGVDTGSSVVVTRRLSTGRTLKSLSATTGRHLPESYERVTAVVVRADGAVAWIGVARSIIRGGGDIEVHTASAQGQRELDSAPGVDPTSLRLRGTQLTWRHGGRTRSATLR